MTGSEGPIPHPDASSGPETSGRVDIGIEALRRLRRSGYLALWDVSCDVRGERVRLLGRLPSYYLKQVAQAVVAQVEGVRGVENLIEVASPGGRPYPERERATRAGEPADAGDTRESSEGPVPSVHPERSRERCWS